MTSMPLINLGKFAQSNHLLSRTYTILVNKLEELNHVLILNIVELLIHHA